MKKIILGMMLLCIFNSYGVIIYKSNEISPHWVTCKKMYIQNLTDKDVTVINSGDTESLVVKSKTSAPAYVAKSWFGGWEYKGAASVKISDYNVKIQLLSLSSEFFTKKASLEFGSDWSEHIGNSDIEHVIENSKYTIFLNQRNIDNPYADEHGVLTITQK